MVYLFFIAWAKSSVSYFTGNVWNVSYNILSVQWSNEMFFIACTGRFQNDKFGHSTISSILRYFRFRVATFKELGFEFDHGLSAKERRRVSAWHDDVIKWKHFPRYWPSVRGINRSSVNSPHKGQWRGALMFSLICARINGWVNNGEAVIWDAIVLIMTSL